MITLHNEKETNFRRNGYGVLDDLFNAAPQGSWELNGEFKISFEVPFFADVEKTRHLVNGNILQVPVPHMERQLFRIYRSEKSLGYVQGEARHIFYDLLDNFIEDTNIQNQPGNNAIQQILNNTVYGHRFTGSSNINDRNANARVVRMNPVEAILDDGRSNSFVSRWSGEIVRNNFDIEMLQQRGSDNGVTIRHRENLMGYHATIDRSTVVTRIRPVGFDGLTLPELYVDSPLMDEEHPIIKEYEFRDVKAAIGEYADDEDAIPLEDAYDELRRLAEEEFSVHHVDEPESTIDVDFIQLKNMVGYEDLQEIQEVKAGDTVAVTVPDEHFDLTSRLVAFEWNPLIEDEYTNTTLGNHVREFTSSNQGGENLRRDLEEVQEQVVQAMQAANGRNTNWRGDATPNDLDIDDWEGLRLGDYYTQSNGEHYIVYQFVEVAGERYFTELINTAHTDEASRRVEEAISEAQEAKAQIEREAEERRADIQAESERLSTEWNERIEENEQIVEGIRHSTEELMNDFDRALAQANFTSIEDLTTTLNTRSLEAIENARESIEIAERADGHALESLDVVNGFGTRITDVESTVDGQVTSINTAIATAERVEQELTRVEDVAEGARVVANRVEETAEGWSREISEVRGDLEGLRIGGVNLIPDSNNFSIRGGVGWSTANWDRELLESETVSVEEWGADDATYWRISGNDSNVTFAHRGRIRTGTPSVRGVYSVYIKNLNDFPIFVHMNSFARTHGHTDYNADRTIEPGEAKRVVLHGTTRSSHDWIQSHLRIADGTRSDDIELIIWREQFESGTTVSDWSPSPEDYETRFVSMEANIEGITNTVSDYEGRISRTEQRADGLYDVVHDPNTGLLTEVGQIAEGWQVTAQRLDDLSVGGRNLIPITSLRSWGDGFTRSDYVITMRGHRGGLHLENNKLEPDTEYILSFKTKKISGDVTALSGHSGPMLTAYTKIFMDGNLIREGAWSQSIPYPNDTNEHHYEVYFRTSSTISDYIYIQPNRSHYGLAYVLQLWDLQLEKGNKATDWTPAPEDMATQAQLSVLHNAIDLAVEEGDVVGRLNVQAGHTLIQNGEILMDADTVRFTGSAFIPNAAIEELHADKITAGTIDAARIDAKLIVAEGLEVDVIKADHISADTAIIEKLFATEANIDVLTSQQAFIDQLSASNLEVDGGRVHGTLNGNSLNFVNIDVNSLSGNLSEFVRTQWNNATNGHVLVDGNGINMSNQGSTMRLADAQVEFNRVDHFNNEYNGMLTPERIYFATDTGRWVQIGHEGVIFRENGRTARLRFNGDNYVFDTNVGLYGNHINSVHWMRLADSNTHIQSHHRESGGALIDSTRLALGIGNRDSFNDSIVLTSGLINHYQNTHIRGNRIDGVQRLSLHDSTTELLTASDNASGVLRSGQQLILGIRTGDAIHNTSSRIIISGRIDMQRNVWMNGNTMYGQVGNESDRRLKMGVEETEQDSLSIIRKLDFVEYEWIDKEKYGSGKQFGLIAQDIDQSLVLYDEESDIYSINSSRLPLVNAHAIQQLFDQHENTLKVASHAYLLAEQHEDELACYKKKIEELEKKVKRLEGAA